MELITIDTILEKVENYITDADTLAMINDAYAYAEEVQKGYTRSDGSPLLIHSLNVTNILVDLNVDGATIIAALVHECAVKCGIAMEEIAERFGSDIALITKNVATIDKLKLTDDSESSAIYLRKILVGLSEDVRVLFIKLADRLHNMQTIYSIKSPFQKQKLIETKNVLIPIAHRLGINSLKSKLEDYWLKYTKPQIYNDILEKLENSKGELDQLIVEMKESISQLLIDHNISFKIKGRVKSVYSIYEKLVKGKKFSDIYDVLALRLILEKTEDCYTVVGLIHSKYRPIPKRFKDFIAMPKENMYQSLHTTVFGIEGHLFEIQLRTADMDEIAEHGIASHWSYKEHGALKAQNIMEQKLELFRNLIESTTLDDIDLNSQLESEFLTGLIYVFTPKGDVVELPENSTPIDFAYRIHSEVGDRTTGAIVNGNIASLDHALQDNDIIEIKTTANSKPNKEWISFVKTSQAKSKIKAFFSKKDKEEYTLAGKNLLEKELRRKKLNYNEIFSDDNIDKLLKELSLESFDEILFFVGNLRYTANYLISIVTGEKKSAQDVLLDRVLNSDVKEKESHCKDDVLVSGLNNVKVNLARCCNPIYGDDIVGYITKGEGVTIHNQSCKNIQNEKERLIDANWNDNIKNSYYTSLIIIMDNCSNNPIADIITKASIRNVNVERFKSEEKDDTYKCILTIKVKNKESLEMFITDINSIKNVVSVKRGVK